jgi:hypothetical protein
MVLVVWPGSQLYTSAEDPLALRSWKGLGFTRRAWGSAVPNPTNAVSAVWAWWCLAYRVRQPPDRVGATAQEGG